MSDNLSLFPTTRAAALARLEAFIPQAGRVYAERRNYDSGGEFKTGVSMLSPYLRHRLISEAEVVSAVLQTHSPSQAEKFIQEVCWRSYWKGWLQLRPAVWADTLALVASDRASLSSNQARALANAEAGQTGIECFDDWAQALVRTGYLHNHARMWLASIWVFTLKLPWSLGADWFLRHLIDGDAASNTLSWRWVAGLQTEGKTYLARPDNIEKYTEGRYRPTGLATEAPAQPPRHKPPVQALPTLNSPTPNIPSLQLIHSEDFSAASWLPQNAVAETWVVAGGVGERWPWSTAGQAFCQAAADDVAAGINGPVERVDVLHADAVIEHCHALGLRQVITSEAPVGPLADGLRALSTALADAGIVLCQQRREWDQMAWPRATKGFFAFKACIPDLIGL